jgi:hypothetical protein
MLEQGEEGRGSGECEGAELEQGREGKVYVGAGGEEEGVEGG